jgi:hypothetical protein
VFKFVLVVINKEFILYCSCLYLDPGLKTPVPGQQPGLTNAGCYLNANGKTPVVAGYLCSRALVQPGAICCSQSQLSQLKIKEQQLPYLSF